MRIRRQELSNIQFLNKTNHPTCAHLAPMSLVPVGPSNGLPLTADAPTEAVLSTKRVTSVTTALFSLLAPPRNCTAAIGGQSQGHRSGLGS